jgi:hypothetical protein
MIWSRMRGILGYERFICPAQGKSSSILQTMRPDANCNYKFSFFTISLFVIFFNISFDPLLKANNNIYSAIFSKSGVNAYFNFIS